MAATSRRIFLLGCGLTLAAGCSRTKSSSSDAASTPSTWTTDEIGHWVLQRPTAWTKAETKAKKFTHAWQGDGMLMQVASEYSDTAGSRAALAQLDFPAMMQLEDYKPVETKEIKVPGAYDGVTRRISYTENGTAMEGMWIVASQWPYPVNSVIALSGEKLDNDYITHLLDTLQFKEFHD